MKWEEWWDMSLKPVLAHREQGHAIRFQPKQSMAVIYCFRCREVLAEGGRENIHAVYESVLQWPISLKVHADRPAGV